MTEHFTSGDWHVKAGSEEKFVETWSEFAQWARKDHPAMTSAHLIRDETDPTHFVSFAEWTSAEARAAWRASEQFAEMLGACKALCEKFVGLDYKGAATI